MIERLFVIHSEFVQRNLLAFIGKLPADSSIEVLIRKHHEKRSISVNARLWALHSLAGQFTGYSSDEMHELALCRHFGHTEKERTDPLTGVIETKRIPLRRSSGLNKKEFGAFMEETEAWYIGELGVYLEERAT